MMREFHPDFPNGNVKCSGQSSYGRLGDGTKNVNSVPVAVIGFWAEAVYFEPHE